MRRTRRAPSRIVVAVALVAAVLSQRRIGLYPTLRLAHALARRRATVEAAASALTRSAAQRVAQVAAFHPGRALCLEQSIVLYVLLRRRGVPAELKLGVQPSPFSAHAWVEHDGRPINEAEDFILRLAPFPSLGA